MILDFITATGLVKWLAGAAALVLGYVGIVFRAKRAQRRADEAGQLKADAKAKGKGNEALDNERAAGGDNADAVKRLHERDNDWRGM